MVDAFADIPGVEVYIDDLLVHAPTSEEHDVRLEKVLERCRTIGLTLNPSKADRKSTRLNSSHRCISYAVFCLKKKKKKKKNKINCQQEEL